jgi:Ca-activated chloride channel family protein
MRSAAQATFEIAFPALADNTEADVLLITDGDIWEAQALVDAAKSSGHRVYALGVGSAPNESMLAEMAVATGGACELVGEGEDMAQAIQRMVQRMRLALPVKAEWQVPGDSLWSSPIPKRIASGETVHLFVRTPQALSEAPVLALDGQGAARPALQVTQDDVLARLLASTQVGLTQDVETAQALAEKYELVTEHTNLLLVIERADADKTDGLPQLHQVVHMTPAGHSGTGRMRFGVDMKMSRTMRTVDIQQIHMCMSGPALHRSPIRRTGTDNMPVTLGGMDDFEIPAFLRKQGAVTPRPHEALARAIIRSFHEALDYGLEYRQAIRVLANTEFDVPLEPAIEAAKALVKSIART